jgi:hypothetical protein
MKKNLFIRTYISIFVIIHENLNAMNSQIQDLKSDNSTRYNFCIATSSPKNIHLHTHYVIDSGPLQTIHIHSLGRVRKLIWRLVHAFLSPHTAYSVRTISKTQYTRRKDQARTSILVYNDCALCNTGTKLSYNLVPSCTKI